MARGFFITLEGIEGAGKSTNLAYIKDLLQQAGHDVVVAREPGGTKVADHIRSLLLGTAELELSAEAETLLIFAARADHLHRKIIPALAQGKTVVCDRFTDSTYAYQGGGRGVPHDRIALLEDWVQGDVRPQLTLLFDVTPEIGLMRVRGRGQPDRFEKEERDFFERARQTYLDMAARDRVRMRVIDAGATLDEVKQQIRSSLETVLDGAE